MKRFFKWFLSLILILLLLVVGTGAWVYTHPKQTWSFVQSHFLPKDLQISWEDFSSQTHYLGKREWQNSLSFQNLCLQKEKPGIDFCFDPLQVQSKISLEKLGKPHLSVAEIFARSSHENSFLPSDQKQKKPEQNFYQTADYWTRKIKKYAGRIDVQKVDIKIDHFKLLSKTNPPMIFDAQILAENFKDRADIQFGMNRENGMDARLSAQLFPQNLIQDRDSFIEVSGQLKSSKAQIEIPNLKISSNPNRSFGFQGNAQANLKPMQISNALNGELSSRNLKLKAEIQIEGLKKPFDHLRPISFAAEIPQEKDRLWPRGDSHFDAKTMLPLFYVDRKMHQRLEKICQCQIPEELEANASAQMKLNRYFSKENADIGDLQFHLQNLTNSLFSTNTSAKAKVLRKDGELSIAPEVDSETTLNSFQSLVTFLRDQKILVPAPLSTLDGKIHLVVRGPIERSTDKWTLPYLIETNLQSDQQAVNTQAEGSVQILVEQKLINASSKVLIKDLALQLPPLDPIFGVPKIAPDRRFEVKPPASRKVQKSKFKLQADVDIKTERPNSIRFFYPLAKPAIPLALNVHYRSGSTTTGTVDASQFQVDYLKRRATIERLEVGLNQPKGVFPVNGRFRVDVEPYRIYIDVLGTTKNTQVVLSSDPYLDRSDIISVLLYGRTNDQLVSIDAKTVGSFDAAMADRAIGLIGLWAFASTPIQSFSYNQLTGQYSAQLKISNDTTLAVGTNWEEATSLELQKRLSDHWIISASLEPNEEDQQTRKIRLQWEDRF